MDAENLSDREMAAILLHQFELRFSALADEFRNDPGVDDNIKESVDQSVKEFKRHFRKIFAINDKEQRKTARDAVMSALWLGAMMAMRPKILIGAIEVLNEARTRPARAERRKGNIQEIIERNARKLWESSPQFKANHRGTAHNIYKEVVAEIRALPKAVKGWKVEGLNDPDAKKRFIENIRKRVVKIRRLDD